MKFKKIQITKSGTLNVVYQDEDSNTITMVGANIVHRDLRTAFRALIPHLALLTEQREAAAASLSELQSQELSEDGHSVYKKLSVDDISLGDEGREVSLTGTRILMGGKVMKLNAPKTNLEDDEAYEYVGDLQLAVDAVKYEAQQYVEEKKWGIKQAELNFDNTDPFEGVVPEGVESVEVKVSVPEPTEKKKRGRKPKAEAAAVA